MNHNHRSFLTIIIPTLNEADNLRVLLNDLKKQQGVSCEIIIADGGSLDATPSVAKSLGARFIQAKRGRGAQMNAAAKQATGDYYFFLHADSRIDTPHLLSDALSALKAAMSEHPRVAGHFCLKFIRSIQRNTLAYRYLEEKTTFNRVNTTNGDQGLLLSKEFFRDLGGFDERLPFLEDQRIAEKIRCNGMLITLPGYLKTSARRFETEGFHRRYILMGIMMGLDSIGATSFFIRAPGVYQAQQETGRLSLSPFLGLVWWMILYDWGFFGSVRNFYRLGRYIRQNSWQMFLFFDVCLRPILGRGRYSLLTFHDHFFAPCTDFRLVNAFVGVLCFFWFMVVLTLFFWLEEYCEAKMGKQGKRHDQAR